MKTIDARNKPCPQPVIMTKKALDSLGKGEVTIIVDNDVARNNVEKLVKSQQLNYTIEKETGLYKIIVSQDAERASKGVLVEDANFSKGLTDEYNLLISKDVLGDGDPILGKILLRSYLYALFEVTRLPNSILFVNSGVFLTTEGSEFIDTLVKLQNEGIEILSCGTCLDFYNLKDKLMVGEVTNMYDIVEKTTTSRTVSL